MFYLGGQVGLPLISSHVYISSWTLSQCFLKGLGIVKCTLMCMRLSLSESHGGDYSYSLYRPLAVQGVGCQPRGAYAMSVRLLWVWTPKCFMFILHSVLLEFEVMLKVQPDCEFHITCHIMSWASGGGGGARNSLIPNFHVADTLMTGR